MLLALLDAFDLVLAFLDFTVEEFDALAGVGGQLHARVLDFHDDAVGLVMLRILVVWRMTSPLKRK